MAVTFRTSPSTPPPAGNLGENGKSERVTPLSNELLLRLHSLSVKGRALEERLIRMQRGGDGYFWIGGPGEEVFNTSLGLLTKKGSGLDFDYLHLHYRSSATMLALGADPIDALRQMRNTATDPYSGGRNFCGHYSIRKWNVVPITSPIEVQFGQAIGTATAQRRRDTDAITIVQGGDAGTAEGDFASALIWSSRPGQELPMLMIVTHNEWGISTPANTQHGERSIADRGKAFGIKTASIDGNDAAKAYHGLEAAMEYVRTERKPFLLEARVSRLYGHSSSSGSNFVESERDCLRELEAEVIERGLRSESECKAEREAIDQELLAASKLVTSEPRPEAETIWHHVFAEQNWVGKNAIAIPHDNAFYGEKIPTREA